MVLVLAAISVVAGVPAQSRADGALNYEGLADVNVRSLDHAQVRPKVVFSD